MTCSSFLAEPSKPTGHANKAGRRLPVASLPLVVLAVTLHLVPGVATWLQFDRQAIAAGEIGRLVTSNFGTGQLTSVWNTLALGLLGGLCERNRIRSFLPCVLLSAVLIPLSLAFAAPQMATYRGLSGIDSALRVARSSDRPPVPIRKRLVQAEHRRHYFRRLCAKVAFEFTSGATLFVDSATAGMIPVPLAHVVGGLVGVACGLLDHPTLRMRAESLFVRRPAPVSWLFRSAL